EPLIQSRMRSPRFRQRNALIDGAATELRRLDDRHRLGITLDNDLCAMPNLLQHCPEIPRDFGFSHVQFTHMSIILAKRRNPKLSRFHQISRTSTAAYSAPSF